MTSIAPPSAVPQAAGLAGTLRGLARSRTGAAAWILPATAGVLVLATIVYVVNLTVSGYANIYYSGAAWAASQSWSAWFFGSIDPANFITVDKPPLATMAMGLSVRLFGLSSASMLLPQALMGVGTVALLMATVRRTFGAPASIIAGVIMALTPAAVLIFRYNNPDALLTLLLVGSAYALIRALEHNRLRWVALAGVLVGLGFETKLLQAFLVLPVFAIVYAIAAPGSIRRRITGLAIAAVSVTVASAWWVVGMEIIPAASRAYIGGSTNNSALDLVLGYDGLGRIFGGGGNNAGGGQGGGGFSGTPGILRLFNSELGGQIAWFLPLSVVGLAAGLIPRFRAPRTDLARAAFLMWGGWLLVHAIVFSFMSGVIHSYYVVAMAPAVGALVGGGVVAMWRARDRHPWVGVVLGLALVGTAGVALMLLARTPSFVPGLGPVVLAVTAIALPIMALHPTVTRGRAQAAAAALALTMLLAAPAAYAVDTMQTAYSGGDPSAGPQATGADGGRGGFAGGPQANTGGPQANTGGTMGLPAAGGAGGNAMMGNRGGGPGGGLDTATLDYLVANQGTATWIVALSDATSASQAELATGRAVMAMGGFTGSDNALTLEQFRALVSSGALRFVSVGGGGAGGPSGQGSSSGISSWVSSACTAVSVGGSTTSVYDCAAAVSR
jgi:4-amino-4-deoxy-L-arabinose transferase-like glycosyltransferase